ncbi:MAG: hypothetical protein ACLVI9_03360 [Anaerostipes hadrus]
MIRQQEETEQKKENERQRELKLLEFLDRQMRLKHNTIICKKKN